MKLKESDILIEQLAGKVSEFAHKHKLNVSTKQVSLAEISEIDAGISSERLIEMTLPVFFYKTQITIHGKFTDDFFAKVFGYKSIIQNKNKSIGVKYTAIDATKKREIAKYLKEYRYYHVVNSTESFYCKFSEYTLDKLELLKMVKEFKEIHGKINTELFVGDTSVNVYQDAYGRGCYVCLYLHVGTIKSENVIPVIENITGKPITELNADMQAKEAKEKAESEASDKQWQLDRIERIKTETALLAELTPKFTWVVNPESGIFYKLEISYSGKPEYIKRELKKRGNTLFYRQTFGCETLELAKGADFNHTAFKKLFRKEGKEYKYIVGLK